MFIMLHVYKHDRQNDNVRWHNSKNKTDHFIFLCKVKMVHLYEIIKKVKVDFIINSLPREFHFIEKPYIKARTLGAYLYFLQ